MSENTTTMTVPYVQAVDDAVAAIAAGGFAVVIDDADRENEGDLIGAAGLMDSEQLAFMVRHTTGIICAPMTADRAAALDLPQMVEHNTDSHGTAFTVTVDHRDVSTGVSAVDRTLTLRALADPSTRRADLRRPGHVFPLRAREGGVLTRAGHTEAAVDLVRLAGAGEVGVISEIVADDGSMRSGRDLLDWAGAHGLPVLRIADLMRYRGTSESVVQRVAEASMPTEFGHFDAVVYRSGVDGIEHLALVLGDVAAAGRGRDGALVRVHSECLTGDIIGSLRCDCGYQLEQALRAVADEGCGVVVYLRGHEGRGIGLAHKIRAYALQEDGLDTVDANTALGQPVDSRSYGVGAAILADLGVRRLRLITNNPAKFGGLDGYELDIVGRVGLPSKVTPYNVRYLRTKRDRMGHLLADDPEISPACEG
ncbi:bifunctional 3,4-dihydroxy-2-butanone-4-phosphate synthase/GTP cyclohydrolase II [Gordonia sp. (in: high G+C Gram-positive bacteria)]|jgi:3,4-dihydroxy 2-butanone 4-phosphate synthase/GTP cyclohydrolase II|uniref:bifunctional 3,4-dihydroxy-2-butanone-4-phosphate synthase/GTP cyclohydrolase II n=1 Tax=Gordonia sp. (in: high G+C Gram-positive bacteria) TaxID=84139 RepID=UPI0025C19C4F|nr:bifunctional 3,4-dihydroxy-2-butanone-4-phosphate synthase/GTP cyclohydrolase II [Gordonia sp. (in: high G+C Gram-positive bacteria)]HMS73847.1 bifunctional 3,4-dihydroxy-2-butanone-4-phosphate synthase/GTP cyclohydrolase II [Gordonia sp. (in: high G+C Gram-positive bacteria)]